jgi:5-methyltetrahydropteroyltriglutamate--homocysteine methyltransferase
VEYAGQKAIAEDIQNLQAAIDGKRVDGFMSALGPLSVGAGLRNELTSDPVVLPRLPPRATR